MSKTTEGKRTKTASSEVSEDHPGESDIQHPQPFSAFQRWMKKLMQLLGLRKDSTLGESFAELIEEHEEEGEVLSLEERTMITNVIGFKDLHVENVMVPRSDIIAVPEDITLPELRELVLEKEHTRMPVYQGSLDDVLGFIHIKDFIRFLGADVTFAIKDIIRDILVVPPSMPVIDLLLKMRALRVHMALVVDEHGGTDGLVTIEDLVEEIVGEIEDEHDTEEEVAIKKVANNMLDVSARVKIDELEPIINMKLVENIEDIDFETLGGLIFSLAGRVPEVGETIAHPNGVEFEVIEADPRRIKRVLVRNIPRKVSVG